MTTGRYSAGASGTSTNGLFFGGQSPDTGKTESWNGSAWTEINDMSTARYAGASSQGPASSSTSALYSGGYTGTAYSGASEEWTADIANKTITTS